MTLHGPIESSTEIVPIMHVLHVSNSSSVTSLPHSVHRRQLPQSLWMITWDSGMVSDLLGVTLPFSSKAEAVVSLDAVGCRGLLHLYWHVGKDK